MTENRNFSSGEVQEHWWKQKRSVDFLSNSRFKLKHSGLLIEGDSLVQHFDNIIKSNEKIHRFSGVCSFGTSSLNLCYLVNRYLSTYHEHDVPVTIIFFGDHSNLFPDNLYATVRNVVIRTLQNVPEDFHISVQIFTSFLSNEFCEYLQHRMTGFAPIELFAMTTKRTAVNNLYGLLLIDYWGIAVCDLDKLDLNGIVSVHDATSKSEQSAHNLEDMREKCAEKVDLIDLIFETAASAAITAPAPPAVVAGTSNKKKTIKQDKARESQIDNSSELSEVISLLALEAADDTTPAAGLFASPVEISIDSLKNIISRIASHAATDGAIHALVKSHLVMLDIQVQLPLTERHFPDLEESCSDFLSDLASYHELFCAEVLKLWHVEMEASNSSHNPANSLFVGDLWDGRLLGAVHLFRLSPADRCEFRGDSAIVESGAVQFSKIQCDLVERIREYAKENFAISASSVVNSEDNTHSRDDHYGNSVMNHNKHTHSNAEITFYTPCKDTYFDSRNEGVDRELSEQKDMAEGEVDGHLVSGDLHVNAIRNGQRTSPLGKPRIGWQEMHLHNSTDGAKPEEIQLLPPKYNALPVSDELESEMREQYILEEGFRPEPWQLRMLESIEQDHSVLIVAPTSSGKTLAAEYAMRKVCRDNVRNKTHNIAVFVQPTNALVDQTYGVFAVDPHVGVDKVAMFTAEVRTDNFGDNSYEVLVTNPQCLQILIMSGHTKGENSFYSRLRYVVFDEIHCIGQDIGTGSSNGVVWEQLLATVDCPIIGLSATLANIKPFYDWLVTIKTLQLEQKKVQMKALCDKETIARAKVSLVNKYNRLLTHGKVGARLIIHSERSTPLHYYRNVLQSECTLFNRISLNFQTPVTTDTCMKYNSNVIKIAEKEATSSVLSEGVQIKRIDGRLLRGVYSGAELRMEFVDFAGLEVTLLLRLIQGELCVEDRDMTYCTLSVTLIRSDTIDNEALEERESFVSPRFLVRDYDDDLERDEETFRDFSSWIAFSIELTPHADTTSIYTVKIKMTATEQWNQVGELEYTSSLPLRAIKTVEIGAPPLNWFEDEGLREVNCVLSQLSILHKNTSSKFGESNFTVCLEKYDREVVTDSFNPLSFLAHIDHFSESQLSSFFEAVPHTKLSDLQLLFSKLFESNTLRDVRMSNAMGSVDAKERVRAMLQDNSELQLAYQELRTLFARDESVEVFSIHQRPKTVSECHTLAGFRLRFGELLTSMHNAVLKVTNFEERFLMDAVCAQAFHQSGLDWYGQQWLDGSTPLVESLSNYVDVVWSFLAAGDNSPVISSLRRLTACLFANHPEQQNKLGVYKDAEGVYPSSVSALNRAVFYYLHLLLVQAPHAVSAPSPEISVFTSKSGESASTVVPRAILSILRDLSSHANDQDRDVPKRFSSETVATLLRGMIANEIIAPRNKEVHNAVKQPTLIFHLSKGNLERYAKQLVEDTDVLSMWFVKSKVVDGVTKYVSGTEGCFLTATDLEEIEALPNTSDSKKKALRYGIGMHVATVKENRKYRRMVEILFQQKKLKFVFCTSSLSYGINMPCSDVLFLGDSPHLTNMVFRQSSGRAGRRGYVNSAGNIYFIGFPLLSIHRKLCMPLDNLSPRQAVSPAYILKLTSISSTCHDNNRNWVDNMTLRGLVNPLFEQLLEDKHHVRGEFRTALMNSLGFTWGFLKEKGYLNDEGKAQIKANIPYREHYMEPKCFLLAELFDAFLNPQSDTSCGYLGLITGAVDTSRKEASLDLKIFLSLVYFASYSDLQSEIAGRTSLRRLDDSLSTAWETYNQSVMSSLVRYIRCECKDMSPEEFPLFEDLHFPSDISSDSSESVRQFVNWYQGLHPQQQKPCARSVFSALSGRGDEFHTIAELLMSVRAGMVVDQRIIPSIDVHELVNNTLETTFTTGRFHREDHSAQSSCEDFSRNLRGLMASLDQMYSSLQVKPKRESKTQVLMDSFRRVKDTFTMQLEKAKNFSTCKGIIQLVRTLKEGHIMGIIYFTVLEKGGPRLRTAKFYTNNDRALANRNYVPVQFDCVEFTLSRGKRVQGVNRLGGPRDFAASESVKVKSVDTRTLTGSFVTTSSKKLTTPQSFHYLFESQTPPELGKAYSCVYSPLVSETHAFLVDFNPYVGSSSGGNNSAKRQGARK